MVEKDICKKIYYRDRNRIVAGMVEDSLKGIAEEYNKKIKIDVSHDWPSVKIPSDYDVYMLHLSDIYREDVQRVKENQSYSYFFGRTGSGAYEFPDDLTDLFDSIECVIKEETLKEIVIEDFYKQEK